MNILSKLRNCRLKGHLAGCLILLGLASPLSGDIIPADRLVDWTPGVTVGVRGGIPENRSVLIDVTQPPFNANRTGSTDSSAAIQAAINAAKPENIVYLPAGTYRLEKPIFLDKSNITVRGEGPNTILFAVHNYSTAVKMGHDETQPSEKRTFQVLSGATVGSTNLVLNSTRNGYGETLRPGDFLVLSASTEGLATADFPIFSVANFGRLLSSVVQIHSVTERGVAITIPLAWNYTNSPTVVEAGRTTSRVGLEDLTITLFHDGEKAGPSLIFVLAASMLSDSWIKGCQFEYANNYQVSISHTVNFEIRRNLIRKALSTGPSHSGLLVNSSTGLLVEDNVFADKLFPAIEVNHRVVGSAFSYNYFTNSSDDVVFHNTHPMMNLFEGNVLNGGFKLDGYFGSASHQTLLRNRLPKTTFFKRWISHMNVLGNVCGTPNASYVYQKEQSNYGPPYPIFELGYPNIGNSTFHGTTESIAWNFPGETLYGNQGQKILNGIYTFPTDQGPTNVLTGDFSNIPAPVASMYPLLFQDGHNTNRYYGRTDGRPLLSIGAGTKSNITLNAEVTVKAGSTIFIAGQNAYQQLQSHLKKTHILHGNFVYTSAAGNVVWDETISDRHVPESLLYKNGAPAWWSAATFPPIGFDVPNLENMIPAERRYWGLDSDEQHTSAPPQPPRNIRIQ